MRFTRSAIVLNLMFVFVVMVVAQTPWKQKHDLGNRWEGIVDIPTGNPPLELLSFTGYFQPFVGETEWRVRYFSPARARVVVYGRDVDDSFQYWMESKSAEAAARQWSEFKWPTAPVLVRQGIQPAIVGVTVRVSGSDLQYLPAIVYPVFAPLPKTVRSYNLQFRSAKTINNLEYTITGFKGGRALPPKRLAAPGKRTAGEPFLLRIDVAAYDEGPMTVVVRSLANTAEIGAHEISFYHRPKTDDQ